MDTHNDSKSRKKKKSMLLIEPNSRGSCLHDSQCQEQFNAASGSNSQYCTTSRMFESHDNQATLGEPKSDVIVNGMNPRRRKDRSLSSLLTVLFASMLLIALAFGLVHSGKLSNNNFTIPTANSSQSVKIVKEVITATTIALVQDDPTTTQDSILTTQEDPEETIVTESSLNRLALDDNSTITTTHGSDEQPETTNGSFADLKPTIMSTVDEAEEDTETEDKKLENELSKVLLSTVGEAADQFVSRSRSSKDEGEDGASPSESPDDNSEEMERRGDHGVAAKLTSSNKTNMANQEDAEELKIAMRTYTKWRSTGDEIIDLFSRKLLPIIVEHGYEVDPVTMTGMLQVFNGIRGLKTWSLKLLDAWAKLAPGILMGTQSDFGDFDECINVRVDDPSGLSGASELPVEIDETTGLKTSTVVGKYCLADVEFPKPPRNRLAIRDEVLQTDYAPIQLRRPLLNFNETADFKDTIFVETGNFLHMLYVDPMRVGICLTNKIDPEGFSKVFNMLFEEFKVTINFRGRCVTKYDRPIWTTYQRVSAYVLVIASSLVILCTLLDIMHMKLNKLPTSKSLDAWKVNLQTLLYKHRPLFTSFSIIRNTKRLMKPQTCRLNSSVQTYQMPGKQFSFNLTQANNLTNSTYGSSGASSSLESSPSIDRRSSMTSSAIHLISDQSSMGSQDKKQLHMNEGIRLSNDTESLQGSNLLCLHGIRVITMTWMIVNHTYLFGGFFVLWAHRRLIDIAEWPKSLSFQLVLNGWLTVETYFFLSAAIIVLNVMPLMKKKKFSYVNYIIHRLVRLLPAYIGLVCLNFLWPLISSGPVWLVKGKSFIQDPCENYLWTNFLFINNWIWPEKQCMVHTWFLSADFQLYILAPVVVYLLHRRPVLGHSLNIIVAIIASVFSGFVIYANKLLPATLINKLEFDSIKQQLSYSYFATYQHMGPYCLGIFIGYLLHKRPQIRLPKHLTILLWVLLPPLSFTTLFLTYLWNGAYNEENLINPSPLVSAFYVAIHRTVWTSLLAWIVFACATGRAKLMSSFLSSSIFIPLSRLSFSIYLVHLPVIMFRALNLRHTVEWSDSNILWEACGNFVVSTIIGYFLNIAFESPIINLERVIFGGGGKGNIKHEEPLKGELYKKGHPELADSFDQEINQPKISSETSDIDSESAVSSEPSMNSRIPKKDLNGSESSTTQMEWPEQHDTKSRKSFRPKQNPCVERIFGSQVVPENISNQSLATTSTGRIRVDPSNPIALQRYSSRDWDSLANSIYSLQNEPEEAPNRGRFISRNNNPRSTQYATLARTTRLDCEPMSPMYRSNFRGDGSARSTSLLGEPVSRLDYDGARLAKQRGPTVESHRGRYNTLTGGSSSEWRKHYNEHERNQWRLRSKSGGGLSELASSYHIQPGIMIPRIDSSTLRRQSKIIGTAGSIVEESTFEEREEAML